MTTQERQIIALLDWYRSMGADEVVSSEPVNWLDGTGRVPGFELLTRLHQCDDRRSGTHVVKNVDVRSEPPSRLSEASPRPAPPGSTRAFVGPSAAAIEAVEGVPSLDVLREKLEAFDGCGLKATAKNTCFYRGSAQARLMFIGEAPGRDEDIEGRPFVGRAGQLLDRILEAAGFAENSVHITNVVYWRPPGNRTPTEQEARLCRPFLEQQIRLVGPEVIVLLGGAAAKNILDLTGGIMRLRGTWSDVELGGAVRRVLPTLHPAYLLRTPAAKRLVWRDVLAAKIALE